MKYLQLPILSASLFILFFLTDISAQQQCGMESLDRAAFEEFEREYRDWKALGASPRTTDLAVQFHVIRPSSGISHFKPEFVDTILQVLNVGFAQTPFQFFQCSQINFIDDDKLLPFSRYEDYSKMFAYFNSEQAINVYLPQSVFCLGCSAWAYLPSSGNHSYIMPMGQYKSDVHVHEMGHVLGLLHTHDPDELVDGSNCKVAGDLCCDTPAEPELGRHNVDADCNYIGNEVDANGMSYTPDVGNYMSYAPFCYGFFTDDQTSRMEFFVDRVLGKFQCRESYIDASVGMIGTDPYPAVENEPYALLAEVHNLGTEIGSHLDVKFYLDGEQIGRDNIISLFPSTPRLVRVTPNSKSPKAAGRYEICVEVEVDRLEVLPFNNRRCSEILIRLEEGIPDLHVSKLQMPTVVAQMESTNRMLLDIENIGSFETNTILGKVVVNDLDTVDFSTHSLQVAEKRQIELSVPFREESINHVCVFISPVFTEERLSNNEICGQFSAVENLQNDMAVDTAFLSPSDSLFVRGKPYQLNFHLSNLGPGFVFQKTAYLRVNGRLIDSLDYGLSGWGQGYQRSDSILMKWYALADSLEICLSLDAYLDLDDSNNQYCFLIPVEGGTTGTAIIQKDEIQIYPNPASEHFVMSGLPSYSEVYIFDVGGKLVESIKCGSDEVSTVNTRTWVKGVYQIKVISSSEVRYHTVVKQ